MSLTKLFKSNFHIAIVAAIIAAASLAAMTWAHLASGEQEAAPHSMPASLFSMLKPADASDSNGVTREIETILTMNSTVGEKPELLAIGEADSSLGGRFTAVQIDDQICLRETSGELGGVCADAEEASESGLVVPLPKSCSTVRVAGLMPDGVETLLAKQSGRVLPRISVEENIFDVMMPPNATTVTSQNGEVSFNLPLDSFVSMAGGCG